MLKAVPIWEPKYKDNTALIACSKVKEGINYLFFCYDERYKDLYSFDGKKVIEKAPIVFNSKIFCYAIPLSDLCSCGEISEEMEEIKTREILKYKRKVLR